MYFTRCIFLFWPLIFKYSHGIGLDNPCPNIFKYKNDDGNDYAMLYLNIRPRTGRVEMKIIMTWRTTKKVSITITKLHNNLNTAKILQDGGTMELKVDFTQFNPKARIDRIIFNKKTICKNPVEDNFSLQTVQSSKVINFDDVDTTPSRITTRKPISTCGSPTPDTSYSNLDHTDIKRWPWLVSLIRIDTGTFFCGGSIISNTHILTAAHCLVDKNAIVAPNTLIVNLGSNHPLKQSSKYSDQRRVIRIYFHDDYNPNPLHNDIAILKVSNLNFNPAIIPVCLLKTDSTHKLAKIAGWGRDDREILQKLVDVEIPIVSNNVCKMSHVLFKQNIWSKNFCGGGEGLGPCNGDSGNGLFIKRNGIWYVKGIVSFNIKNSKSCNNNNYAAYTNVAKYYTWISDIIE